MYILLDIAVVVLLIIAVWRGLKKGFFNTSYGFIGALLVIAFSAVFAVILTIGLYKLGITTQMQYGFINLIGETNGLFKLLNVTSEQIAYWLALAVVFIVLFILCYIVMLLLNKSFLGLMEDCRDNKVFMVIDSTIGLIINLALVVVLVLGLYAIVYSLNSINMLTSFDEVIRACPLSGLIYKVNPLNEIIKGFLIIK